MSWTYGDVDRSADPLGAVRGTDTMASWPLVQAYKRRTRELLAAPGARPGRLLDVGCGAGEDTRALPGGSVGLDAAGRRSLRPTRRERNTSPEGRGEHGLRAAG